MIGPGTERALVARGIVADLVPDRSVAEALLDAFPDPDGADAAVLIARAEQARDVLPDGLAERGYTVDILPVYRTVRADPDAAAVTRVREGRVDAITFTSSSTVTNLCDLLGAVPDPQPLVVSIGPVTSDHRTRTGPQGATPRPIPTPSTAWSTHSCPPCSGKIPAAVTFPARRMRRLRRTPALRRLVAEARVSVDDLVAPLFVKDGIGAPEPVISMPGVVQHTQESLRKEVRALADLGVPGVILFGVPATKDRDRVGRRRGRRGGPGRAAQPARRDR